MRIESSVAIRAAHPVADGQAHSSQFSLVSSEATTDVNVRAGTSSQQHDVSVHDDKPGLDLNDPVLDELVDAINRKLEAMDKRLQFLVHEASGRVQLRVLERSTNEVIREVPSEQLLDLVGRIHDLLGVLVDETV